MTVSSTSAVTSAVTERKTGFAALGSADFLKLMTVQMQQQDPFDPVDQKEMLAQMAQFSSLSETAEINATLKAIGARLDAIAAGQSAAANVQTSTQEA
ncbi:MAG: flagellar biosynthesis protein FlgD [Novosphingobium sp.]|nr:flagellar biosynthesis protein FlgD [Novosphingobium sp.]